MHLVICIFPYENVEKFLSNLCQQAEAIEAQYARIHGQQILFSAQQIVDCSSPEGNFGCHGGMVDWSYQYVMRAGGLMSESDYPYRAEVVDTYAHSLVIVTETNG